MNKEHVLKLLLLVIDKVMEADYDDQKRALEKIKGLISVMQDRLGSCEGPYTDSIHAGLWCAYGCDNHVHIINFKFGCFTVEREFAEKMLALGGLP